MKTHDKYFLFRDGDSWGCTHVTYEDIANIGVY